VPHPLTALRTGSFDYAQGRRQVAFGWVGRFCSFMAGGARSGNSAGAPV